MNQAFVKDNDGWRVCQKKREACLYADDKGQCILESCRIYPDE